jgi:hypothetical protein
VTKAAEVFGDRWTPIIMRELCFGTRSFGRREAKHENWSEYLALLSFQHKHNAIARHRRCPM